MHLPHLLFALAVVVFSVTACDAGYEFSLAGGAPALRDPPEVAERDEDESEDDDADENDDADDEDEDGNDRDEDTGQGDTASAD